MRFCICFLLFLFGGGGFSTGFNMYGEVLVFNLVQQNIEFASFFVGGGT